MRYNHPTVPRIYINKTKDFDILTSSISLTHTDTHIHISERKIQRIEEENTENIREKIDQFIEFLVLIGCSTVGASSRVVLLFVIRIFFVFYWMFFLI